MSLRERVEATRWYHTIDLPDGVVTPGHFDHRPIVAKVPLPSSLAGKRCLDVGTWDGFWAFEMERRGAESVLAIDLADPTQWDWPADTAGGLQEQQKLYLEHVKSGDSGFEIAREALGSQVERRQLSVYDLDPGEVGEFDFAYLGTLLMHLRDPVRALTALRSVVRGEAVIADGVDAVSSYMRPRTPVARLEGVSEPWWWQPNRAGLHRMVEAAGWTIVERTPVYYLPLGVVHPRPGFGLHMLRSLFTAQGRERVVTRFLGVPHAAVRVRPQ